MSFGKSRYLDQLLRINPRTKRVSSTSPVRSLRQLTLHPKERISTHYPSRTKKNIIEAAMLILYITENTRLQSCRRGCEQLKHDACQSNGGPQASYTKCNKWSETPRSSLIACYKDCENIDEHGKRSREVDGLP
jgi:hypothetical protein